MNLKIDKDGFKLEIQNGDASRVEKIMVAAFAFLEGESFVEKYESLPTVEETKTNNEPAVKGIKKINGKDYYQCSYNCMCGNKGKRFVKKDAKDTACHSCNSLLTVVPASETSEHDDEFNYYVAYG